MASSIYVGGSYDGTITDNSPMRDVDEVDFDGGPVERYEKTENVDEEGRTVYRYVGTAGRS